MTNATQEQKEKTPIDKGMDRLAKKAAEEEKNGDSNPKDGFQPPPGVEAGPVKQQVNLIPWPYPDNKYTKAKLDLYFVRVWDPNKKCWNVVCNQFADGMIRPTAMFGKEECFPIIENMKKSNPMIKVGWVKFKMTGWGEE